MQDLFAQLWKEYALSDSRYLTSDTFVLSAEAMSVVFLGSLAWLMVYLICVSSPYRHPVQIMICIGHLYSDMLYYATAMLDYYQHGIDYCRPESYYFWVYYFGMNFVWIIVPLCGFSSLDIAE
jgi:cholestenol Delta-isomerase